MSMTPYLKVLLFVILTLFLPLVVSAVEEESSGEVVIEDGDGDGISEYRINGQLYMVRVRPEKGPVYYLVDTDGDGNLETRRNELSSGLLIPTWVLKRW